MAEVNGAHLLDPGELAEHGPPEAVRLPIDLVDPSPNNPRQALPEIDALAQSIRDFGLLQPVVVRHAGGRYELIGGHRRWSAFLLLAEREPYEVRWKSIPAVVRDFDDDTAFLALVSSQVHNRAWQPREEAAALERLAVAGMTLKEIGARLHRTESWASKRLGVYSDSVLSGFVQTRRLAATVAEELRVIADPTTRREYAERATAEGWSQAHARTEVRKLRASVQVRQLSRRARELRDLLSRVPAADIPATDAEELLRLARLIMRLAKTGGTGPIIPPLPASARSEPRRTSRQKARPKRRMMPLPA